MKKSMAVSLIVAVTLMVSGVAMAKKPAPPTITGNVINACYKAVNGQLRVVSGPSDCLPSELPLSWALSAPAASAISGTVGTITGSAIAWVFAGPTATVTTLAAQKISGVVNAQLGIITGEGSFDYDLCYVADGLTTLTNFAGVNNATGTVSDVSGQSSFSAAGSVVPGAGTWRVGFCVLNSGVAALDDNSVVNGWVIVTQ